LIVATTASRWISLIDIAYSNTFFFTAAFFIIDRYFVCSIFSYLIISFSGRARLIRSKAYLLAVHSYESAPDAEIFMILFEPRIVDPFEAELSAQKPIYPFLTDARPFEPLLERITLLAKNGGSVEYRTACSYLQAAVGELLDIIPLCEVESVSENMTKPILLYCSEHFADEDMSIQKIADELYISSSYVSKVFSSKLKYRFREYVNRLRISRAKELLSKTDMRVVNIMLECGFKNQSSFNRIFSDICGISPREYRAGKTNKNKS